MPKALFGIQITGLKEAMKNLDKFSRSGLKTALVAGLEKSSDFVLTTLKGNTPVDTGNLRESMEKRVNPSNLTAFIGPNLNKAHYAPFVELGHHTRSGSFVPGQHFIQLTGLETARGVVDIFRQAINIQLNRDIG
jgi:HK97 gp10 family phage protein